MANPIRNVQDGGGHELAIVRPRNPAGPWLDDDGGRQPEGPEGQIQLGQPDAGVQCLCMISSTRPHRWK